MHVKASTVVQSLSPSEGVPAPIYRVLLVLELMSQVITWVQELMARSRTAIALGLVRGRFMQTNVDKIIASVPTGPNGREIDLVPVLDFCVPYACRATKMVDHSNFVFDVVPTGTGNGAAVIQGFSYVAGGCTERGVNVFCSDGVGPPD